MGIVGKEGDDKMGIEMNPIGFVSTDTKDIPRSWKVSDQEVEMEAIVSAQRLRKTYGTIRAADGVSFDIERGEIFGLLGPNGAGKTTTIRILSGLTVPDSGLAIVDGCDVIRDPVNSKRRLGVVPETANLYGELTAIENLVYMAQLYGVPKAKWKHKAEELLNQFGLYERKNSRFQSLSRGMKRRLTIAAALMHQPKILFLDEPTTGLDIMSARSLRTLIRDMRQGGVSILLTTHLIQEAEDLCDRIGIMVKGKILLVDTVEGIKERTKETEGIELKVEPISESLVEELGNLKGVERSMVIESSLRLYGETIMRSLPLIIKLLEGRKVNILSIQSLNPSLEDAFVKLTGLEADIMKIEKPAKMPGGGP